MKKTFFVFVIFTISIISFSFYNLSNKEVLNSNSSRDIVLQFITYNGYGNNLFIDNVLTGRQTNYDITVTSILNIPYDTVYSTKISGTDTISPSVTVSNIGRIGTTDSVQVFLEINPGGFIDSSKIAPLASGQTVQTTFRPFTYNIGTGYFIKSFISVSLDSNRVNDTLFQYSVSLPGFQRNVLYEEFTSNSSPSCANNNDFLNIFVNRNFDSVVAIKYHTGLLGLDSFYIQNPVQADARMRYYYISAVPTTFADGKLPVSIPYGDSTNLYNPYYSRMRIGTPFNITVVDENVSDDSIRATVNVSVASAVPAGNFVLRINAVERYVNLEGQGTNGETNFYDIFRATYPDTNGISISPEVGNYQFQYTYYKEPFWVDSMIYTSVFIQNNNNREVMNSAKGRNIVVNNHRNSSQLSYLKADPLKVNYDFGRSKINFSEDVLDTIQTSLNVELFESFFPPLGWRVYNQDGFITFQQFTGANGPTISGAKCVFMDFFDYNIIGQRDSMYSKVYRDLIDLDTVRFDYAYAQYSTSGSYIDSLTVKISTDGGLTFPSEIFRKGGNELATAPQTTTYFVPSNSTMWRSYKYSLQNIVSVNSDGINVPVRFSLNQNYPNPFNPETVISYELPVSETVILKVFDILGKEIKTLVSEKQNSGVHQVSFNASGLPSGVYFYQLNTQGFTDTKRMVLIR